jgi:hypothetical protein
MPEITKFLDASRATAEFKRDVLAFAEHHAVERVHVEPNAPRVKVLRVLAQLLTALPDEPIERVSVAAESGCSDFRGTVTFAAGAAERTFDFVWDCAWRAEQEGWTDYYGYPDQIRAARSCHSAKHCQPNSRAAGGGARRDASGSLSAARTD